MSPGRVSVSALEALESDPLFGQYHANSKLEKGFWSSTSLRFLYLNAYVQKKDLHDVFHIEYDNLVYVDFCKNLEQFRTKMIWVPFENEGTGICSFMYFRDAHATRRLAEAVVENSRHGLNDMITIWRLAKAWPEGVGGLPIIANYTAKPLPEKYSAHAEDFKCLFDACAVGQYVDGTDGTDAETRDSQFFINDGTVFKCDKATIEWRLDDNKTQTVPFLNNYPLVNLHMHSKNLGRWMGKQDFITGELLQKKCEEHGGYKIDLSSLKGQKTWQNPRVVFCEGHDLRAFIKEVLPKVQNDFMLVTHNSDENITDFAAQVLNHKKLIDMYSQNVCFKHAKLHVLPIGIANSEHSHGDLPCLQLMRARTTRRKPADIYFSFAVHTNAARRAHCKQVLEGTLPWVAPAKFSDYIATLATYKFAICPEGNGVDSHRIWECLYLDVIPIVERNAFTDILCQTYGCIVLLERWEDLNDRKTLQSVLSSYTRRVLQLQKMQHLLTTRGVLTL